MSQSILQKGSYGSYGSGSRVYEYEYEYEFITSFAGSVPSSFSAEVKKTEGTVRVLGYGINLI